MHQSNQSNDMQKQLSRGVLRKRCSEKNAANLQENTHAEVRFACFPVNLLRIFRTHFPENTSGWLLMDMTVGVLADVSNISNVSILNEL